MVTFLTSLVCLIVGYFLYGSYVERVFNPDAHRKTPIRWSKFYSDARMENIVYGSIFAGAMRDYLRGMLLVRQKGKSLPELIGEYLGANTKQVRVVFVAGAPHFLRCYDYGRYCSINLGWCRYLFFSWKWYGRE